MIDSSINVQVLRCLLDWHSCNSYFVLDKRFLDIKNFTVKDCITNGFFIIRLPNVFHVSYLSHCNIKQCKWSCLLFDTKI